MCAAESLTQDAEFMGLFLYFYISACFHFRLSLELFNKLIYYLLIFKINISIISEVENRDIELPFKKFEMPFNDKNSLFIIFCGSFNGAISLFLPLCQ